MAEHEENEPNNLIISTNESSLHAYKNEFINELSPSFCSAKWYNATIWLGTGQTASCHHPPSHAIDPAELGRNPSAIHNTQHKKNMRRLMQDGIRPNECEYCWKIEDMQKDSISDRVMKSRTFTVEENIQAKNMPWDADVALRTLEISFDRTCNFACSYCNPSFSTSWVRDIKQNGPYQNIQSDGRGHYISSHDHAKGFSSEEENPYIRAFWEWFEGELSEHLREIRITGGEPLMAPGVWKLFEWFEKNPERATKLNFAINSNLTPKTELLDRLIEKSHSVPVLDIYTSMESVGKMAEYIRDGLSYDQWFNNVERLIKEGNIRQMICMSTINGLCLPGLVDFLKQMRYFKKTYGCKYMTVSLNILRFPSFQSCAILPDSIKMKYKEQLQDWYDTVKSNLELDLDPAGMQLYNAWELSQVERLIDYLDIVKTPHAFTAETPKLYNDFKQFYLQYDLRRKKNFGETFPQEYLTFINEIPGTVPDQIVKHDEEVQVIKLIPDSVAQELKTGGGYVSDELKDGE
jgi:organic radical activating enzyme